MSAKKIFNLNKSSRQLLSSAEQSPHFVRAPLAFEKQKFTKWQRAQIRSSETTRETPKNQFDFTPFSTNKSKAFATDTQKQKERLLINQSLATNKRDFLEWFIGFFEAEGCCTRWKENNRNRFRIEVSQQDKDLIYFIQKQFGFGKVNDILPKNGNPYWRFLVEDVESLLQLIDLLNGNLVLKKRRTNFAEWLQVFNTTHKTQVLFRDEAHQITLADGWFSGFLEGDGGFSILQKFIRDNKKGQVYAIKQKFFVTQKDGIDLLTQIHVLLKASSPVKRVAHFALNPKTGKKEKRFYDRLETATLPSAEILFEYLTRFPFLGKRQTTIDAWHELIEYRKTKPPVTPSTTATIQKLIDQTKRIENQLQAPETADEIE
nr:putative site-specific DNA endonuclease [Chloroidium sp. KL-2023a]